MKKRKMMSIIEIKLISLNILLNNIYYYKYYSEFDKYLNFQYCY